MSEQDIHQRQADATGLAQSARQTTGERPYLGDPLVVDGLVRTLAAGVLDQCQKAHSGQITREEAIHGDQDACWQLARIMIGKNSDYAPVPGWSETGLANSIRREYPEAIQEEGDESVVA